MLEEIKKALEALEDWAWTTGDGVLRAGLWDPYYDDSTGLAIITADGSHVDVKAWAVDPDVHGGHTKPDWTRAYDGCDARSIAEDLLGRCPRCGRPADRTPAFGGCACERKADCPAGRDA